MFGRGYLWFIALQKKFHEKNFRYNFISSLNLFVKCPGKGKKQNPVVTPVLPLTVIFQKHQL